MNKKEVLERLHDVLVEFYKRGESACFLSDFLRAHNFNQEEIEHIVGSQELFDMLEEMEGELGRNLGYQETSVRCFADGPVSADDMVLGVLGLGPGDMGSARDFEGNFLGGSKQNTLLEQWQTSGAKELSFYKFIPECFDSYGCLMQVFVESAKKIIDLYLSLYEALMSDKQAEANDFARVLYFFDLSLNGETRKQLFGNIPLRTIADTVAAGIQTKRQSDLFLAVWCDKVGDAVEMVQDFIDKYEANVGWYGG